MRILALFTGFLLPFIASAATPPQVNCQGLPGCGGGMHDPTSIFTTGIPLIITLLLTAVAAGAIIGIIWAGILMLTALGDEGKITKAKHSIGYSLAGLALAMSAESLVSYIVTEDWGQQGGGTGEFMTSIGLAVVDTGVAVFNGLFVIIIIYAGMRMLMARGKSDEFHKAVNIIRWAVIGAIVVNLSKVIISAFLNLPISW